MNDLIVFNNPEFGDVRTVTSNVESWFVGKDVAAALGYANPQKALRDHVDEEDRTVNESFTVNGTHAILINESGVYSLIFSSKLDSAKKFKRWVTGEVLPALRKKGYYGANPLITTDDYLRAASLIANCKRTHLPLVLNLIERSGIPLPESCLPGYALGDVIETTGRTARVLAIAHANGLGDKTIGEMTGLGSGPIWRYRVKGIRPRVSRGDFILKTCQKALPDVDFDN